MMHARCVNHPCAMRQRCVPIHEILVAIDLLSLRSMYQNTAISDRSADAFRAGQNATAVVVFGYTGNSGKPKRETRPRKATGVHETTDYKVADVDVRSGMTGGMWPRCCEHCMQLARDTEQSNEEHGVEMARKWELSPRFSVPKKVRRSPGDGAQMTHKGRGDDVEMARR
eukprot:6172974-Pleurochrysis_carterae.AAC.2